MITIKFGGTSLADAARYRHAADIILADPQRRYAVVSAPGRRFPEDIKITDLLYRYHASGAEADLEQIRQRFSQIADELNLKLDLERDFAEMRERRQEKDYIASRGEYLSARIMAALLGWHFADTADCIFFDENGELDMVKTTSAIWQNLNEVPCAVLPGFYGSTPDGKIRTFSRGGSDITGALVARAMESETYENWTDVDGMLATDPHIVADAAPIRAITYAELRELAYRGATVLHEDSVLPVREAGIPIHICNTFRPEAPGSWILPASKQAERPITGIAGRLGYATIQIERENTNSMVGYVRRILTCLENRGIPFEHLATGLGSVCLVVPAAAVRECSEELKEDIRKAVHPDTLQIEEGLAMIAVVGRGMVNRFGIAAQLFSAVAAEGISVRVIDQGSTEMNIVIGVNESDYTDAVNAIYRHFFL